MELDASVQVTFKEIKQIVMTCMKKKVIDFHKEVDGLCKEIEKKLQV